MAPETEVSPEAKASHSVLLLSCIWCISWFNKRDLFRDQFFLSVNRGNSVTCMQEITGQAEFL
jgi:hypothetical protein